MPAERATATDGQKREARTVNVWKATWLPGSETFIRNQTAAIEGWNVERIGIKRVPSPISCRTDRILYGEGALGRLQRKVFLSTRSSLRLRQLVQSGDLVHAHFLTDAHLVAPTTAKTGTPLIITAHGRDVTASRSSSMLAALAQTLASADRVIAVSQYIADQVIELGAPSEKVVVHHIGIPISTAPETMDDPEWDLVFVGRLIEKKGVTDLLRAMTILDRRSNRPISTCIVGEGPLSENLRKFARRNRLDITWKGSLPPREVHEVLRKARIFVGPSRTASDGDSEGLGMVFLEASAARLPVVSYRHGGIGEGVEDGRTGILVPEGDVEALADGIFALLASRELRLSMGRSGRERIEALFEIGRQTRILEAIYDDVLAGRSNVP